MTYNALNRRISKPVAGVAEKYAYDGDNLYLQFNDANTPTHRYLHGGAVDSLLADEDLTVAGGDVLWQLTDHQQSVRKVFRGSNGTTGIVGYSVHGDTVVGALPGEKQFTYAGREFDPEVGPNGAYYMRARYYDRRASNHCPTEKRVAARIKRALSDGSECHQMSLMTKSRNLAA